jgi:hypothetical protein
VPTAHRNVGFSVARFAENSPGDENRLGVSPDQRVKSLILSEAEDVLDAVLLALVHPPTAHNGYRRGP